MSDAALERPAAEVADAVDAGAQWHERRLAAKTDLPLIVDLDGCLIRTDLLFETAFVYLSTNPLRLFRLLGWAFSGRAQLKRKLAETAGLDLQLIPANEQVEAYAREAKENGREVYLATGSDELLARKIGMRFDFLDGVIASDGSRNLKGRRKAEELRRRFPDGFDYVGDCNDDLHVWRHARKAILVEPDSALSRSANALGKPVTTLHRSTSALGAFLRAARLHQWAKNTLVFVPALLAGQIARPEIIAACAVAFFALGIIAFGTYLINDLLDLSHDRRHPSKRYRPLASGQLGMGTAVLAAPALIATGLAIGAAMGASVFAALLAYLVLTLAYSMRIKKVPILDSVTLGGLFTLRLVLGIAVAGVMTSPWLLVFSMLLFTSLCLAKRCAEIQCMENAGVVSIAGRGYVVKDAPFVLALGLATATASILIMVLYLIFDAFSRDFYGNPNWLWGLPIVLFVWITHIWLVGHRGKLNDDPVAYAIKDRKSLVMGAMATGAFAFAWLGVPL
jgi:4-hydroxybenzoate polyprenyltransferase